MAHAIDTRPVASPVDAGTVHTEPRGLLEILLLLAGRKRFVVATTLLGGIAGAILAWVVPVMYTATAIIMPPQQQRSSASALLGQLGSVLSSSDLGLKSPADLYLGLLGSRSIADVVIAQFNLEKVYETKTMTETRSKLARCTQLATGKDSLIKISVEDTDAKRAAALANAYVEALYAQSNRLALTEASQRRLFFERQVEVEKNALGQAEMGLKGVQEHTGILQLNSQVEAVIRSMAQLRAEITGREVFLERLKTGETSQNPDVIREEAEIQGLHAQLGSLEAKHPQLRPGDPLIPMDRVPQAGVDYVRSLREMKYHESLFEILSKQYEVARIDEAKEAPIIQVVDRAIPADRKSWPPRLLFIVLAILLSGAGACGLVILTSPDNAAGNGNQAVPAALSLRNSQETA